MISQPPAHRELSTNATPPIRIWLFGAFRVNVQGIDVANFRSHKSRALLAYLLLAQPQPPLRSDLGTLLWPGYLAQSARSNLRQSLSNLRDILAPFDLIATDYTHVTLLRDPTLIWCDAWQFAELLDSCQRHPHQSLADCADCRARLQAAVALYGGGLLANFPAIDSEPFHTWLPAQQQHFAASFAEAQAALAKADAKPSTPPGNLRPALTALIGRVHECQVLEQKVRDPVSRCVSLVGTGGVGKTRLALAVAAAVQNHFADGVWLIELAPVNDPALLPEVIADRLGVHGDVGRPLVESIFQWLQSKHLLLLLDNCEHLIDSCAHFAAAALQAAPTVHLLTTSREALNIAGELIYPVAPLTLPPTRPRAVPATAPQAAADNAWLQALLEAEAARLFIDRATLVQPTFGVTLTNAPALAQICHQLDGLPLALELAAARMKALSVEQIAERMQDRFRLLRNGPRDAVSRHQTLQALVDWSYALLTEPERILLRRLAVFADGWTLAAAEAICSDDPFPPPAPAPAQERLAAAAVFDLLANLVEKSLVVWTENQGTPRYRLLETIRQYAYGKLQAANEHEPLAHRRHAYFFALAREGEVGIQQGQRAQYVDQLRAEQGNLRAVIGWACDHDPEAACHLVGLLRWYWFFADNLVESNDWYQRVLALPATALTPGRALVNLAYASLQLYNYQLNPAMWEQVMLDFQRLDDPVRYCEALLWLGITLPLLGKRAEAQRLFAQNEAVLRQSATPLVFGCALSHWGVTEPEPGRAHSLFEEALAVGHQWQEVTILAQAYREWGVWWELRKEFALAKSYLLEGLKYERQVGERRALAMDLCQAGDMIGLLGDWPEARRYFVEALQLAHAVGLEKFRGSYLARLGYIAGQEGEFAEAERYLSEGLALYQARNARGGMTFCLICYAELRRLQGFPHLAVQWLATEAARTTPFSFDQRLAERALAASRNQLRQADFDTAWAAGQSLTLTEALVAATAAAPNRAPATVQQRDQVIAVATPTASPHPNSQPALPPKPRRRSSSPRPDFELSLREIEVARLVAQGLSNRAIANQLTLSERTVERHVANILNKQGFTTRTQIATWAVMHGLDQAIG